MYEIVRLFMLFSYMYTVCLVHSHPHHFSTCQLALSQWSCRRSISFLNPPCVHVSVCECACVWVCVCVHESVCMCARVCVYICACSCIFTCRDVEVRGQPQNSLVLLETAGDSAVWWYISQSSWSSSFWEFSIFISPEEPWGYRSSHL